MTIINKDHLMVPDGKDSQVQVSTWTSRIESSLTKET